MITVPLINWQPIANIPEDRKDGRQVLLWVGLADVGTWEAPGHWEPMHDDAPLRGVTYWADINPPE